MGLLSLSALERPLVNPGVIVGVADRGVEPGSRARFAEPAVVNFNPRAVQRALARVGFVVVAADGVRQALVARVSARGGNRRLALAVVRELRLGALEVTLVNPGETLGVADRGEVFRRIALLAVT